MPVGRIVLVNNSYQITDNNLSYNQLSYSDVFILVANYTKNSAYLIES